MRKIKYGFFGEDMAHRIFLENYLRNIQDEFDVEFKIDEDFCKRFRATNDTTVDEKFRLIAEKGLNHYGHEVFFVGRDADTTLEARYPINEPTYKDIPKGVIVMMPVQSIEHWLLYIKQGKESGYSTKNISFEEKSNKSVKLEVYGLEVVTNSKSTPIVNQLTMDFDVNWLSQKSKSFNNFHTHLKLVLAQ